MSRRPVNPSRRFGDSGGGLFSSSKSRSSPILSVALIVLVRANYYIDFIHIIIAIIIITILDHLCLSYYLLLLGESNNYNYLTFQGGLLLIAYLYSGSGLFSAISYLI